MGTHVRSIAEARVASRQPGQDSIWMTARAAALFHEPGWVKLEPPRNGAVLFIHPLRRLRAARKGGCTEPGRT
jgi:hypothetical protein